MMGAEKEAKATMEPTATTRTRATRSFATGLLLRNIDRNIIADPPGSSDGESILAQGHVVAGEVTRRTMRNVTHFDREAALAAAETWERSSGARPRLAPQLAPIARWI
jgi:hypothetical protein